MVRPWFWKGVWLTAALRGHVWLLMASILQSRLLLSMVVGYYGLLVLVIISGDGGE